MRVGGSCGLGEFRRAGHGVDVLLKVYAKCIDGQREAANTRILEALSQ
ncbi:hypothetical protein ACIBG4_04625 [Nonomuraea sp. NPDC050383]